MDLYLALLRWGLLCRDVLPMRGALYTPFTLTDKQCLQAVYSRCTFRGAAPPRRYPAPCPGARTFLPRNNCVSDCSADLEGRVRSALGSTGD